MSEEEEEEKPPLRDAEILSQTGTSMVSGVAGRSRSFARKDNAVPVSINAINC